MISNIFTKTKSLVGVLLLAIIIQTSCTDNFENINQKIGEPTEEQMGAYFIDVLFAQMIDNVYSMQENSYQMNQNLIGDPFGRHLSITNKGFSTPFSTFNANDNWINYPFNDVFTKFYGAWYKLQTNVGAEKQHLLEWSNILRVATMHRIADMYGPIPYSQVVNEVNAPYDSVEELYKNMFADLDKAIIYLTKYIEDNPEAKPLFDAEKGDIVYNANLKKWVVFANSLKLRLAMRVVYADETLAKTKAEEAVNHKFGVLTSNEDAPQYVFSSGPNGVYQVSTAWGDSKPAADIITYMKGYEDPRLSLYFTKAEITDDKGNPYPNIDYLGIRTGITLDEKSKMMTYSGDNQKADSPSIWMTAAEAAFLRAEGALRGWKMGGTAQDLYKEGIKLSFSQWKAASVNEYLQDDKKTQADYVNPHLTKNPKFGQPNEPEFINTSIKAVSKITVKWDDAATFEEKLERIITQKWIAIYPLGTEAWSEQRRTGYPRFFPVMVNSSVGEPELTTKLASRIPFPPAEQQKNKENYDDAVKKLGGADKYGTRLWWDKKTNKPNW